MRWTVVALSLLCALAAVASATRASNEDRPMICPSDRECYPLFFEATDEFQVVKPGQVLDPSMHTKMDSQTGVLEAKLRSVAEEDATTLGVLEEDPDAAAAEPERMTYATFPSHRRGALRRHPAERSATPNSRRRLRF